MSRISTVFSLSNTHARLLVLAIVVRVAVGKVKSGMDCDLQVMAPETYVDYQE